jgi:hypothetical protein
VVLARQKCDLKRSPCSTKYRITAIPRYSRVRACTHFQYSTRHVLVPLQSITHPASHTQSLIHSLIHSFNLSSIRPEESQTAPPLHPAEHPVMFSYRLCESSRLGGADRAALPKDCLAAAGPAEFAPTASILLSPKPQQRIKEEKGKRGKKEASSSHGPGNLYYTLAGTLAGTLALYRRYLDHAVPSRTARAYLASLGDENLGHGAGVCATQSQGFPYCGGVSLDKGRASPTTAIGTAYG